MIAKPTSASPPAVHRGAGRTNRSSRTNLSTPHANALLSFAAVLRATPDEYRGYQGWQVYYTNQDGTFLLP